MPKKILIALASLVALVLVVGLVLPSKFRVERSTTINAPAEAVYAHVANLRRWRDWSPWNTGKYPGTQWVFGGTEVGVGAVHSWSGTDVGNGTLSLTEADPKTGVAYDMALEQGRYVIHGRISFAPADQGTQVTWVDEGNIGGNPLKHYLVLFFLKPALGGKLEEALAGLKKQVEASPLPEEAKPEPTPAPVEQASSPPQPPASAPPTPPVAEGSSGATPPAEGTQAAPPVEDSPVVAPGETAPTTAVTTPSTGEQAPAPQGTAAPSGEPVPAQAVPAEEPAPAPASAPAGASATPTQP
jgi:hypothetical protein